MKKVLFATTALVAFAGAAAAEVKLSGYAEMGVIGGDSGFETQFHTDIDVKFSLSGTTDGGLEFGATIDLDEEGGFGNTNGGPEAVFIKGDFGTLTMGDTDGALDWALTETAMLTSIADDHTSHGGYNGNGSFDGVHDGQVARYDYSFGDFAIALSAEIDDTGTYDATFGIGGKYSGSLGGVDLGVGVALQSFEDVTGSFNTAGISVKVSASGFDAVVNYVDWDGFGGNDSYSAIGIGYTTGALSLTANTGVIDLTAGGESKGWGAAANYDLGGGAVVMVGFGDTDGGASTWSAGLGLSF
jgi:outer membrane protein OmpU